MKKRQSKFRLLSVFLFILNGTLKSPMCCCLSIPWSHCFSYEHIYVRICESMRKECTLCVCFSINFSIGLTFNDVILFSIALHSISSSWIATTIRGNCRVQTNRHIIPIRVELSIWNKITTTRITQQQSNKQYVCLCVRLCENLQEQNDGRYSCAKKEWCHHFYLLNSPIFFPSSSLLFSRCYYSCSPFFCCWCVQTVAHMFYTENNA